MDAVRQDNEFMDRGSDFEFSREDSASYKEKYDRIGNRNRGRNVRGLVRDTRDRSGIRQNDVKGREVTNGHSSSSSSVSGRGGGASGDGGGACCVPRRCSSTVRTMDKEPGELSSERGSGDAIDPEAQVNKGCEVINVEESGPQVPVKKKRKFSPIVWDGDDVSSLSKNVNYHGVSARSPPHPLAAVNGQLKIFIPDGRDVETSPVDNGKNHNLLSPPPVKSSVVLEPAEDSVSKSTIGSTYSGQEEVQRDNGRKAEQIEDEYYVPRQNISCSRWASWEKSLADESEIMEYPEMSRKRKKTLNSLSLDSPQNTLVTDDNEVTNPARSLGEDDCPGDLSAKGDYIEVDDVSKDDHSCSNSEDGHNSHKTPEPIVPPQIINMLQGCRSVNGFERLNKIDEGTYGVVYRARDRKTGEIVALKKVKMAKEREGFPLTSLREINILLSFDHPSIVDVKEVVVGSSLDSIFMVMEYMEHDMKGLMDLIKQPFSQSEVKCLMLQLLEGVKYLHDNWVLHRDLKTSNLLLNNRGELKICDFGLARQYGIPLKPYTHLVVTLWYRAPELLLGAKQYSTAIDMWSLGCIMAELLSKEPLFNGETEFDQLDRIFRTLGTPSETIWPGFSELPGVKVNFLKHQYNLLRKKFPATPFTGSPVLSDAGFDLLSRLLTYDPEKRITAEDALNHKWFCEVPLPKSKDFMPTFPTQHAQDRRLRRILKSPDPLEAQSIKELQQGKSGTRGVFA